jgi:hypothetical protein
MREGAQTIQNEETSRKSRVRTTADIHPLGRAMWIRMQEGAQTIQIEETSKKSRVRTTADIHPPGRAE